MQACGGPDRAEQVTLGFSHDLRPRCYCDCAAGYEGSACESVAPIEADLPVLLFNLDPVAFVAIALLLCVGFLIFLVRRFVPNKEVRMFEGFQDLPVNKLQTAEAIDVVRQPSPTVTTTATHTRHTRHAFPSNTLLTARCAGV